MEDVHHHHYLQTHHKDHHNLFISCQSYLNRESAREATNYKSMEYVHAHKDFLGLNWEYVKGSIALTIVGMLMDHAHVIVGIEDRLMNASDNAPQIQLIMVLMNVSVSMGFTLIR